MFFKGRPCCEYNAQLGGGGGEAKEGGTEESRGGRGEAKGKGGVEESRGAEERGGGAKVVSHGSIPSAKPAPKRDL